MQPLITVLQRDHTQIFPPVVEYVSQTRSDQKTMLNRVSFHMIQMTNLHNLLGLVVSFLAILADTTSSKYNYNNCYTTLVHSLSKVFY